jgi:ribose transport system substrate-binding protein
MRSFQHQKEEFEMGKGFIDGLLEKVRTGQMSRRDFFRATGGILGASVATSLLGDLGLMGATPAVEASPEAQVGKVRPEDWQKMEFFDCTKFRKDPPWKIANLSQGPTNSWALMLDGHAEYAVKEKYKDLFSDYFLVDGQGSAAVQVSAVETLLTQKPDVLVSAPLGAALKGPLERVWDAGIPVIQMQMPYLTDKFLSYINGDNYKTAQITAKWLAEKIGGKGKILMESGIAGTDTAEQRLQGAKDVFAKYPNIEVLAHGYHNWSISESKKGFEAWIAAYPQFDGIWCDGAFGAIGAVQALVEAKRDIPPVTAETLNGFLKLAKQYNVDFYAFGYPNAIGLLMVDMAVRAMRGEVVPRFEYVDPFLFGKDEIDKYVRPDMSDDLWVDYRYPLTWLQKQFPK